MAQLPSFEEVEKRRQEWAKSNSAQNVSAGGRTGGMRSFRDLENERMAEAAAKIAVGLSDRVNNWLADSSRYIESYNTRFVNRDETQYVADSDQWLSQAQSRKAISIKDRSMQQLVAI